MGKTVIGNGHSACHHDAKVILLAFVRSVGSVGFCFGPFGAVAGEENNSNRAAAK